MAGYWVTISCPHCGKYQGAYLLGIHSGLGPPVQECRACGGRYRTSRSEWTAKGLVGKLYYVIVSLLYVAGGGFLGGSLLAFAFHMGQHPEESRLRLGDQMPAFVVGCIIWGALVAGVQIYRVYASLRRAHHVAGRPSPAPAWSLQRGIIVGIFLSSLVVWVILVVRARL